MPMPDQDGPGWSFPFSGLLLALPILDLPNAPYAYNPTHADDAVGLLLTQFRDRPRIVAMVRALIAPAQRYEHLLWQLLTRVIDMENAEGVHLELFGHILDLPRAGLTDDEYLSRLRVWQFVLRSNGRAEELIRIVDRFEDVATEGGRVVYDEVSGAIAITLEHAMTYSATTLIQFLRRAKAGGVRLFLIWEPDGPDATFAFADTYDDEEEDWARGMAYDDEDGTLGGTLADVRA